VLLNSVRTILYKLMELENRNRQYLPWIFSVSGWLDIRFSIAKIRCVNAFCWLSLLLICSSTRTNTKNTRPEKKTDKHPQPIKPKLQFSFIIIILAIRTQTIRSNSWYSTWFSHRSRHCRFHLLNVPLSTQSARVANY